MVGRTALMEPLQTAAYSQTLDFTYSGANAVDGCSTNDTCSSSMPIGTFVLGGGGPNVIVVEQMGYNFVPDVIDVNIGDTVRWIWGGGDHSVVDCDSRYL